MKITTPALVVGLLCLSGAVLPAEDAKRAPMIRTEPPAHAKLQKTALELSGYLKRITTLAFKTAAVPDAEADIILCLQKDAASIDPKDKARLKAMNQEAYMIRGRNNRIVIAGNTPLAVQHGMFDYLERLGCRWLIPGVDWTVIPKRDSWFLNDLRVFREPIFFSRRIWYAYGYGIDGSKKVLARDYQLWHRANRLGGLASFKCGHSYGHTVTAHKSAFMKHPEYFAMAKDGKRLPFGNQQSLCYSNPDLARIFIAHRLKELKGAKAGNPHAFMVSMDPNDGSVACNCEPCKALGNGSDQALHLANQVARALKQEYPDAAVGMYIYASHRLPPTRVRAEPNIYVQLAMAFNRSGLSYEELAKGWRKAGVGGLGIREYFGVMAWDWGLPGRGRGSSLAHMRKSIPLYKEWGATSFNAETNVNWGTFGPGQYVAARLMWDEKGDADAVYAEYFRLAFGKAGKAMQDLHTSWGKSGRLTVSNMHAWLVQLGKALECAKDESPEVNKRLEDMIAYMHYVVLMRRWQKACAKRDREKAYDALKPLLAFTWRIRTRQVVHSYALQRRLVNAGAPILKPLKDGWRFNHSAAVWRDPTPVTSEELRKVFQKDLSDHPTDDRLVAFSRDLLPLRGELKRTKATSGALRHNTRWLLLAGEAPATVEMQITKGRLTGLELQDQKGTTLVKREWKKTDSFEKRIQLKMPSSGVHRLILRGRGYRPEFPEGAHIVCEASETCPFPSEYLGGYIYVPNGTKTILAAPGTRLSLQAPSWSKRRDFYLKDTGNRDCVEIPVGEDAGKVWSVIGQTRGTFYFYNIPPYVALERQQLLVPAEVHKDNLLPR